MDFNAFGVDLLRPALVEVGGSADQNGGQTLYANPRWFASSRIIPKTGAFAVDSGNLHGV